MSPLTIISKQSFCTGVMSEPLYDLEQFEVLRGSQGTLFGKSTPGGYVAIQEFQRNWSLQMQLNFS